MTTTENDVRDAVLDVESTSAVTVAQGEVGVAAATARAVEEVRALFVVAASRPRDMDVVRQKLLRECKRPGFAESATYTLPFGEEKASGPTIRFAEAALAAMGNCHVESTVIYDDLEKRMIRVRVMDLESCVPYVREVVVDKTVERRFLRKGQTPLSVRVNASGKKVYTVKASEPDLLAKVGREESKALRTLAMRLLPGWLRDEALATLEHTIANKAAEDPDAFRRKLVDAFQAVGIDVAAIKGAGYDLGRATPAELAELRSIYQALRDGDLVWEDVVAMKNGSDAGEGEDRKAPPAGAKKLREALSKAKERREADAKVVETEPLSGPEPDPDDAQGFDPDADADMVAGD